MIIIHSEIKPPLFLGWAITSSGSSSSTRSYLFLNEEFFTLVFVHFLLPFLWCKILWSSESESSDLTHLLRLGLKVKIVSFMSLVCHKKSYLMCWIFEFSKYYVIFILIFFQCTKLRQPTGQRQLLENK